MKARNVSLKLSILSVAMLGISGSMYAYADDEEAAALMNPTSSVTVEEIYVSQGSQKFGEYNGLNKQGGYINGNINVRGGGAYKKNAAGDTDRWSIQGTDLGLSDRSASVGYSDQGDWGAKVGYDELQHNLSPGYQTPYQGSMGGNSFNLPTGFKVLTTAGSTVSGGVNTGTRYTGTGGLTPALQAQFQNQDISSTRQNTSFNAEKILDNGLSVNFDFNHLNQTGAKLMGFPAAGGAAPLYVAGESIAILPNPTSYQTDTMTAAINWQGEKARLTGSYFGSFFRDSNNGVTFQNFGVTNISGGNQTQTMSTAPSNQLQQLNLGGGYDFSNKTKLVGSLSYGRNTQNASSSYDPMMMVNGNTPAPFNGLVNTAHADLKVTDQSVKDLSLSAGYKYDSHLNLSQSNIQQFYSVGLAHPTFYPNTPLSTKKSVFELAGDYRLTKDQKARLAYTNTYLNRSCNQYATGTSTSSPTGGGTTSSPYSSYPAGADCVTANFSRSNNLTALYKVKASETVDMKLSYGLDVRQTTWNQTAIAAFYGKNINNSLPAPLAMTLLPGQNGGDYVGFRPFFEASRNQQMVKGNINWQTTDDLTLGIGGKYTYDQYPDSTYGVQNANLWSVNFDANYNYAEAGSVVAYAVQQNGMRNLTNLYSSTTVNAGNGVGTWNNAMTQNDTTLGLGIRHNGLFSGKVDLVGDATYSLGQTNYSTGLNSPKTGYACDSNTTGTCGNPGAIVNRMAAIKLGASYKIDKSSKIGLRYIYQHLASNDFYYNGLQTGYTPNAVLPTNQTTGSYNVNVIAASYTYSFD